MVVLTIKFFHWFPKQQNRTPNNTFEGLLSVMVNIAIIMLYVEILNCYKDIKASIRSH